MIILTAQFVTAQIIIHASVTSVPLYITSTFSISCELFDHSFTENKQTKEIKNTDLKNFSNLLNKSTVISRKSIDVRGKLSIHFENKVSKTICFNEFGIFFNGRTYFENKPLLQFLLAHKLIEY